MTIEELKAYDEKIQPISMVSHEQYDELWNQALKRYADESDDDLLKIAVDEFIERRFSTPWGHSKIIEFRIGKDKLIWNHEARTLEGPKHIVKEIEEANERWRGEPDYDLFEPGSYDYRNFYAPPGDLWNPRAFGPLVYRIYGPYGKKRKVTQETLEFYPKDPLDELYEKLGYDMSVLY